MKNTIYNSLKEELSKCNINGLDITGKDPNHSLVNLYNLIIKYNLHKNDSFYPLPDDLSILKITLNEEQHDLLINDCLI